MYTLSSWRSHVGTVVVDLLHQEPARTVEDPSTAYVPGEVTQVPSMTNVHPKFLEKTQGYRGSRRSAPGTHLQHMFLKKSARY